MSTRLRKLIPRFSLRTLVVFMLLVTSGMALVKRLHLMILSLSELWYAVAFAGLLVWSVIRDRKALRSRNS